MLKTCSYFKVGITDKTRLAGMFNIVYESL